MCQSAWTYVNPEDRAASICPFSIDNKPLRTISDIIAASNIVKATIAAVIISNFKPASGSAKYVKNIIKRSGKFRITSTIKPSICEMTGIFV